MAKAGDKVRKIILEAIKEAGTTEPSKVALAIEDVRLRQLKKKDAWDLFKGLESMGIKKYSDVVKLVERYKGEIN